jgi:hypothetical protein
VSAPHTRAVLSVGALDVYLSARVITEDHAIVPIRDVLRRG